MSHTCRSFGAAAGIGVAAVVLALDGFGRPALRHCLSWQEHDGRKEDFLGRVGGCPGAGPVDWPQAGRLMPRPGKPVDAAASLLELWNKRRRLLRALGELDEIEQACSHNELSRQWTELDDRIVQTPSRSHDDLRGKIAFMRWWLDERANGQQEELMQSIIEDVERMFLTRTVR